MRVNAIVIDDFYAEPQKVRDFALKQEFKVRGNYPGQRTESYLNESIKKRLQEKSFTVQDRDRFFFIFRRMSDPAIFHLDCH